MSRYVVARATGRVGSTVAGELIEQGRPTAVIVRDAARGAAWSRRGTTAAVGSRTDPAFLSQVQDAPGRYPDARPGGPDRRRGPVPREGRLRGALLPLGRFRAARRTSAAGGPQCEKPPQRIALRGPSNVAPRVGFEPTTLRLTAGCSAVELPRNKANASRLATSRASSRRGSLTTMRSHGQASPGCPRHPPPASRHLLRTHGTGAGARRPA
jgi:hypothetical protein